MVNQVDKIIVKQTVDKLRKLFADFGEKTYGEACSQTVHGISSAQHATDKGLPKNLIIAAFLHDIGHFIADQNQLSGLTEWGHPDHADIAAQWLTEHGFPDSVVEPVKLHVDAKRYLSRPENQNQTGSHLSTASRETLQQQGGYLSDVELEVFLANPWHLPAIQLRHCDDQGKPHTTIEMNIDYWLKKVEAFLRSGQPK